MGGCRLEVAKAAWVTAVRDAISSGYLIEPAGANAADILAEENSWDAERATLTAELSAAIESAISPRIEAGDLEGAERHLEAAFAYGDSESLAQVQVVLEAAYVDREANRMVSLSELNRLTAAAPRYPQNALRRDITGWVDVYFTITPDGETTDIEVGNAEPADIFNKAAMQAVEKWTFEPVEYRGQTINKRAGTRLVFNIE